MATDKDGFSGLHLAVESGDIATVKLLLEAMKAKFTDSGWSQLLEEVKEIALRVNKHMGKSS
ncbi:unnamed protein product [Oikopleura dioica]|uniref:Uncharacterized protein n=1 Tax=Oikopleura dioica TaxID=34765 RepID=E4Z4J4_OIKDI|nr:unnamed protein product [Oikopleura dioica]